MNKKELHDKYRVKFGCKNPREVCWCEVCVNVERLINELTDLIKRSIG